MTENQQPDGPKDQKIRIRLLLTGSALLWESLWRALWPLVVIAGTFLAVSLAGGWQIIGGYGHLSGLFLFALALVVTAWRRLPLIHIPSREATRRRLETDSGVEHRPIQALEDTLAPTAVDDATRKLWLLSKQRAKLALARLRPGWPRPGLAERDPRGLRFAVGLLLFVGLMAAGASAPERLAQAFTPDLSDPVPAASIEGWVTPPTYTGLAPVLLTNRGKSQARTDAEESIIRVPHGSTLFVRVHGGRNAPVLENSAGHITATAIDIENHELTGKIEQPQTTILKQDEATLATWSFAIIPDEPPQAAFKDEPSTTARLALRMPLLATDDYGVAGLHLTLQHGSQPVETINIALPGQTPATWRQSLFRDFTPHKWAGLPVTLVLHATDAIGQSGRSQIINLTLPERIFEHPVAKAIIEQRKRLASDGDNRRLVFRSLRVIATFPDEFSNDAVVFLALRSAIRRLELINNDKATAEVIDILWDTALRIEDGELSLAERALRQAEQRLMEALSRNADQAEIDRLTQELKQAMDRFLQAMLEEMARNSQAQNQADLPIDPNARSVDRQDLQKMLDQTRELSRLGARDAAREMLSRLRNILENLRAGVRQGQMSPRAKTGHKALGEMGKLMQRQQELLDQSQRRQREGKARPGDKQSRANAAEQEALRRRLGEVMRQLGEARGDIPKQLGWAERSMRGARKSLQQGALGDAAPQQSQALQQMRAGAEALARALSGERGRQGLSGRGQMPVPGQNSDPMGRPLDVQGNRVDGDTKIPDQSAIQRARRILEELEDRASDLTRSRDERNYLDRLLKRF